MRITSEEALKAATKNDHETLKRYIEQKGDLQVKDQKGNTLLLLCIREYEFDDELAMFLINSGVPLDGRTNDEENYINMTALHCAYLLGVKNSKTFQFLLKHQKTDLNAVCDEGEGKEDQHFSMELRPGDNAARSYTDGYAIEQGTLLHYAVLKNDIKTVQQLCEIKGVNLNAKALLIQNKHLLRDPHLYGPDEGSSFTPGHGELIAGVWVCRTAVNIYRIRDVTPLHLAARSGNVELTKLLIKAGADPKCKDSLGNTPSVYAVETAQEKNTRLECKQEDKIVLQSSRSDTFEVDGNNLCGFPRFLFDSSNSYADNIADDQISQIKSALNKVSLQQSGMKGKKRLFVGEGNFSYSAALLAKHSNKKRRLGSDITATEYKPLDDLKKIHGQQFCERIAELVEAGATVLFGVDGRTIHQNEKLTSEHYQRIHFNFPHDQSSFKQRTLPKMLADFFVSASKLQQSGDRILMALPKPSDAGHRQFYESYVYNIFNASAKAGYVLINKRKFGHARYPHYQHNQTNNSSSASVADDAREYIFEKTSMPYEGILKSNQYGPGGFKTCYDEKNPYLKMLNTDSESSDYGDDDSCSENMQLGS